MSSPRIIPFIAHVLRNGRFRNSGYDFEEMRQQLVNDIPDFPFSRTPKRMAKLTSWLPRALVAEAALIKNSLRSQGGHLSSADGAWLYVRIPKAASTSLCGAILHQHFPALDLLALRAEQINAMTDLRLERNAPEETQQVFTVVRDPFARIVSVYRAFFERHSEHFLYEDYLFGIIRQEFTFTEFVNTIRLIPDTLKDQHFQPQHRLIAFYEKRAEVTIIRLEDRDKLSEYLMARGLRIERLNSGEPYDLDKYYDLDTLEKVNSIYQGDIERFGYGARYQDLKSIIEQRPVQN